MLYFRFSKPGPPTIARTAPVDGSIDAMAAEPVLSSPAASVTRAAPRRPANTPFSSGQVASRAAIAWACATGSNVV